MIHKPVLLREVIEIFDPKPGEIYIDATINGGGHAYAILEKIGPEGKLLGIDWDCRLIDELNIKSQKLKIANLFLNCDNYANLSAINRQYNLDKVNGILFDLGFSSNQLESSGRGFSFLKNEPLDMRYNTHATQTNAATIINTWEGKAIENILREYGEERYARRIARGILYSRSSKKIATTSELVGIVQRSVPSWYLNRKIHPATRTFQALRIAVNSELENLASALKDAPNILKKEGIVAVISFHSLEDRIVKNYFRDAGRQNILKVLTSKPLKPTQSEIEENPRARSARLRAAQKI